MLWQQVGDSPDAQVQHAFELALGRQPDHKEVQIAKQALHSLTQKWQKQNRGTRTEVVASKHLWLRESEPDRVFEDDLVSVWSRNSSDKARRFGLLEFDLSGLKELELVSARIELASSDETSVKQTAALVPPGIVDYNWTKFERDKKEEQMAFESLGAFDSTSSSKTIGGYVLTRRATQHDLKLIAEQTRLHGRMAIVLMAVEDGKAYRRDWDDGKHQSTKNKPPRLVIYDKRNDTNEAARRALHDFCHALFNSAAFLYVD